MSTNDIKPKSLHSRLLYPFFFNGGAFEQLTQSLSSLSYLGKSNVWEACEPHDLYFQEMFETTSHFLFGASEKPQYFKVPSALANTWFKRGIRVETPSKSADDFSLRLMADTGIELFVLPQGVGILSLSFEINLPDADSQSLNDYKLYNYYLAQLQRTKTALVFSLPHPFENENFKGDRSKVSPAPKSDVAFEERLGKQGGRFYMLEFCDYLLQGIPDLNPIQRQFSIYTVAMFDKSVDFSSLETRQQMAAFLSGLAQIEEVSHAGHLQGESLDIANHIMNRKHWAAMSFIGAAHLLADQGVEFDNQRLPIIFRKYFSAYLVAYFQRLILQRLLRDASSLIHQPCNDDGFCQLHSELLDFNVTGLLTEVSSREALNRYFHMGQDCFAIEKNTQRVNHAIRNYDANKVTKGLAENIDNISKVQGTVEWFEVLFITGATAQLMEYIGKNDCYHILNMTFAPIIVGGLSLFILRPWKNKSGKKKPKKWTTAIVTAVFVMISAWWAYGTLEASIPSDKPVCEQLKSLN